MNVYASRLLAGLPVVTAREFARRHGPPQPLIALDVGDRRVGVAFSDEEQIAGFPAGIVERGRTKGPGARESFLAIREEHPAKGIIVGFPYALDGTISEQCVLTLDFLRWLRKSWPYESILLWDERLSSVGARAQLSLSKRKARAHVDHHVAAALLNEYLDSIREQN